MTDTNLMLSKRPVRKKKVETTEQIEKEIDKLEKRIETLRLSVEAKEEDPRYLALVKESRDRMMEIAIKAMGIPVDHTLEHAELVGQFNERLRLTRELAFAKSDLVKSEGLIQAALRRLQERLTKQSRSKND